MRFPPAVYGLIPVLCLLLLAPGCALLIPDNPSEPRYNKVVGERHMPEMNPRGTVGPQSSVAPVPVAMAAPSPEITAAPLATPAAATPPSATPAMALPPVSAQTRQIAQQRIDAARSIPEENIQLASGDYPLLNDVPRTAPATGDAAAAAQLEKVRVQLEGERANASATTREVKAEAAAEPSMLSDLPPTSTKAPAPKAIPSKPIAPPAPALQPATLPSSQLQRAPVPEASRITQLPPPPAPLDAAHAPIAMDAMPMGEARVPVASAAPAPAPAAMASDGLPPIQLKAPLPPMASADTSFDPMQGASGITLTPPKSRALSGTFLPSSRYAYRR